MEAVGEVVSQVHEKLIDAPCLAVVFASVSHREAMPEVVEAVTNFLAPDCLLATLCDTVIEGNKEITASPAIALWATSQGKIKGLRLENEINQEILDLRQPGDAATTPDNEATGPQDPTSQTPDPNAANAEASNLNAPSTEAPGPTDSDAKASGSATSDTLLLIADPFSFPTEELLLEIETLSPNLSVIGGLASAANQPGGNQLWLNDNCYTDGAVGAILSGIPSGGVRTRVSQGCQPVGNPFTITRAEAGLIFELGGRPALQRLRDLVTTASPKERQLMRRGILVGIAVNESQLEHCDFLVRGVVGIDQERGAIAVGGHLDVGDTVQFHMRDAQTAAGDLHACLEKESTEAALLFTCNGRGANMFGAPDREVSLINRLLENVPLAGMSCAGEIGPIGDQSFLLGFTASLALFGE